MLLITKTFQTASKNFFITAWHFVGHNIKIVFGNKFVYFMIFAILLFITILLINLFNNHIPSQVGFYYILILPSVSIILYPAAFGVQMDKDLRSLEVLFGIPDYRYKVWLVRLLIIFATAYLIVLFLSLLCHILITDLDIFRMAWQIMFPTMVCGCFAFMLSTVFKNGTGAAVVLVLVLLVFFIFQEDIEQKTWNLYLNPFLDSGSRSQMAWDRTVIKNRMYLMVFSILFLLFGLFNLQKREGFLK
jgi:hypothetical protein